MESAGDTTRPSPATQVEQLTVHNHLCLVYDSLQEQMATAVPFMRAGLERGERCVYAADDNSVAAVLEAMRAGGIDTDSAMRSGAFSVLTKRDTYLREGRFDPDGMIGFLREAAGAATAAGFTALRATGEMTWALGGDPGVERLLEYESKLNVFCRESDVILLCQYSRKRFKPEVILGMIYTHPKIIMGKMVYRNIYYVPPEEFLKPFEAKSKVDRLLKSIAQGGV